MKSLVAKKSLGQNFLQDSNVISKIIEAFTFDRDDVVLEIGPGMGAITDGLIKKYSKVNVVELDRRAIDYLQAKFPSSNYPNLSIFNSDIIEFDLKELNLQSEEKIRVIGNIPYNLSSEILFYLIKNRNYINSAQLMLQREVAQRLAAKPNSKEYGITTIAVNLTGSIKRLFDVPPTAFNPVPRVTSSVIDIQFDKGISYTLYSEIMKMVRMVFNHRRKQLRNTIMPYLQKKLADKSSDFIDYYEKIKPNFFQLRPENLKSEDFVELLKEINGFS
jgi:16S rRNA (adenine1518-N6/adenine1519-N6)-dimethyltransferase